MNEIDLTNVRCLDVIISPERSLCYNNSRSETRFTASICRTSRLSSHHSTCPLPLAFHFHINTAQLSSRQQRQQKQRRRQHSEVRGQEDCVLAKFCLLIIYKALFSTFLDVFCFAVLLRACTSLFHSACH